MAHQKKLRIWTLFAQWQSPPKQEPRQNFRRIEQVLFKSSLFNFFFDLNFEENQIFRESLFRLQDYQNFVEHVHNP